MNAPRSPRRGLYGLAWLRSAPRQFLGRRIADGPAKPTTARVFIGVLAERLVAEVLDARLWDRAMPTFPVDREVATGSGGGRYVLAPDIWWAREAGFVEVKAGIERFFLAERQWNAYLWAQRAGAGKLPVYQPRVFYAFVAYRLPQPAGKYPSLYTFGEAALAGVQYLLVLDSRLVASELHGNTLVADWGGPLSPLLGIYEAHYSLRAGRLSSWGRPLPDVRARLRDVGGRWVVRDIDTRALTLRLLAEGWGGDSEWAEKGLPAMRVIHLRRRARADVPGWLLPGEQSVMWAHCRMCGAVAPIGECPVCFAVTAF